jgi:hypothetical protein
MYSNTNNTQDTIYSGAFGPVSTWWYEKVWGSMDENPPSWSSPFATLTDNAFQFSFSVSTNYPIEPGERLLIGMQTKYDAGEEHHEAYSSEQDYLNGGSPLQGHLRARKWDKDHQMWHDYESSSVEEWFDKVVWD